MLYLKLRLNIILRLSVTLSEKDGFLEDGPGDAILRFR
jgi:hypothetical protein